MGNCTLCDINTLRYHAKRALPGYKYLHTMGTYYATVHPRTGMTWGVQHPGTNLAEGGGNIPTQGLEHPAGGTRPRVTAP